MTKFHGHPVVYNGITYKKSGLILFAVTPDCQDPYVLIVMSKKKSISFPKGGIEEQDLVPGYPITTFQNAAKRELSEETGIHETLYHTLPKMIITEKNENNTGGKLFNISYSVGITDACHPLKGEEGKGNPEWMSVSKVIQLLELEGLERAPLRKQALLFSLSMKNLIKPLKTICV